MAKQDSPKATSPLQGWQRDLLVHAGIILAFLVLVILYFKPAVIDGKVLDQHDIKQYEGMAKETRDFREATGEEALWVSTLFSGMPAFQTSVQFPNNWFTSINIFLWLGLPRPAGYVFVTFLGFFLLLRVLKVNPWLSGIGAAAFALSSYFFIILGAGHTSKANAISFMAPVLAGVLLTYQGRLWLGGALTAFTLALEINANHFQITYYLAIAIGLLGIFFLVDAIRQGTLPQFMKASVILLVAAGLGVGPNIGRIWTTAEYAEETMRGKPVLAGPDGEAKAGLDKEYALRWSFGTIESFSLMIPNIYGGPSSVSLDRNSATAQELRSRFGNSEQITQIINGFPAYWGPQPGTSPVYAGAIVCFLFILGLFLVKGPLRGWLIAVTLLFMMLSWGRNFSLLTDLFFAYFPAYNKFRAVSMMMVMVELSLPLLGFLALQRLVTRAEAGERAALVRPLLIAGGIAAGLALFWALLGPLFFEFSRPQEEGYGDLLPILQDYRQSALRSDALRAAAFILAAGGLIWLYLTERVKATLLYAGLAALVLLDMVPVNLRYLNGDNYINARRYEQGFQPSPADSYILQTAGDDPNYRVFNFTDPNGPFNDAHTSYFHKSVGGYHAAKLRRYQDLIERHLQPEINELVTTLRGQPTDSILQATLAGMQTFNMLNTRYFILDPNSQPLPNRHRLGHAWFVEEIQRVNSPDAEIAAMNTFDPARTAIVDVETEGFGPQLEGLSLAADPGAQVRLTAWQPNALTYTANSSREGVIVFSEIYYDGGKGWQAYLDGEAVPHFRANYVLRGLRVPAGTHEITFKFEPKAYQTGETLDLIFSILVLASLIGAGFLAYRQREEAGA